MAAPCTRPRSRLPQLNVASALFAMVLVGCGGGDGAAPTPLGAVPAPAPAPGSPVPPPVPAPPPIATGPAVTPLGTPEGFAIAETIGPAGGKISSAGDRLTILIPPGALAAPTEITIQPITNTMPNGVGQAYRLRPEGLTFAVPVTITFNAAPVDIEGTDLGFLRWASQTAAGTWQPAAAQTSDTTEKSVSVQSKHFSDWAVQRAYVLSPPSAVVNVNESINLFLSKCDVETVNDVSVLTYCAVAPLSATLDSWRINQYDVPQNPADLGALAPTDARAIYTAPSAAPAANPVAVSARLRSNADTATPRLVSNITIDDSPGFIAYAEVRIVEGSPEVGQVITSSTAAGTWRYSAGKSLVNNAKTYVQSGHVSVSRRAVAGNCTSRARGGADFGDTPADGMIVVPLGADAGKYSGSGGVAQITLTGTQQCGSDPETPFSITIPWLWWNSTYQNPENSVISLQPDGSLRGSNRIARPLEVIEQTFKFTPARR